MLKKFNAAVAILALPLLSQAHPQINDRDLGKKTVSPQFLKQLQTEGRQEGNSWIYPAQQMETGAPPEGLEPGAAPSLKGILAVTDHQGRIFPARWAKILLVGPNGPIAETQADGAANWSLTPAPQFSGTYYLRFELANRFWVLLSPDEKTFDWEMAQIKLPLKESLDLGTFRPDPQTANGHLGNLYLTYLEAIALFEKQNIDLEWWSQVKVIWPSDSDYYQSAGHRVHLTNAKAWDVNLHELGHSIVRAATRSNPAGGPHKIDECYTAALAWSEGFPTFFAAAVRFDAADADPKFEFLVPRRAPIKIENVPDDVCRGAANEWRVAAALWDLMDSHSDGLDQISISFNQLWSSLYKQKIAGLAGAWNLIQKNLSAEQRQAGAQALRQNTIDFPKPSQRRRRMVDWNLSRPH